MSSSPKAPSATKVLFGFHAVGVRLKTAPQSIVEVVFEGTRAVGVEVRQGGETRVIGTTGRTDAGCSSGRKSAAGETGNTPIAPVLDELSEDAVLSGRGDKPGFEPRRPLRALLVCKAVLSLTGVLDPTDFPTCLSLTGGECFSASCFSAFQPLFMMDRVYVSFTPFGESH